MMVGLSTIFHLKKYSIGNKEKKRWDFSERRNKLRKVSQLHAFSFLKCKFEKLLMTEKSNVSAYQSCTIEQSFDWKINYRHT